MFSSLNLFATKRRLIASVTASSATNVTVNPAMFANYVPNASVLTYIIPGGVVISSTSTSTPALTISGFAAGDRVNIINSGYIVGRGGTGGTGAPGGGGNRGTNGAAGGPALSVSSAIIFTNNGVIGGGGGGGGGGAAGDGAPDLGSYGGGGGGGAGNAVGSGGPVNLTGFVSNQGVVNNSQPGSSGTLTTGGGGGSGGNSSGYGNDRWGWGGGQGGALGSTGSVGAGLSQPGGAGGAAVTGNSNITWIAFGTRYGSIT